MKEVILALIKDMNGPFMVAFVALVGIIPIALLVTTVSRGKKLVNNATMTRQKQEHEETMFKLSRELPEVIGSERAIEHKSVARREE